MGITAASNALFADISPKKSLEDALLCDIFDKYAEQLFKEFDEIIDACTERQLPECDRDSFPMTAAPPRFARRGVNLRHTGRCAELAVSE